MIKTCLLAGMILLLTGCQQVISSQTPDLPIVLTPTEGADPTMTPSLTVPSGMQRLIELAKQDLAQRLSISTEQIDLIETSDVVWPDSSLGCPQEGMMYTQVLTPGYLIYLEYDGNTFEYHAGRGNTITTCETPSPPVPGTPGDV